MNSLPRESYLLELFSSLTSLCPHHQLSTKSENHLFIHNLCLPLLPPPVKHLSNAKPSPTPALPTREKKWKKRILGHRELAETGDKQFDEVKGQSSGSDECVTLTLSPEVQIRKEILRMLSTPVLFFFLNNLHNSFT